MEPDDLLCSRNTRPQKDEQGAARCPSKREKQASQRETSNTEIATAGIILR